jgi:hypothetical protein
MKGVVLEDQYRSPERKRNAQHVLHTPHRRKGICISVTKWVCGRGPRSADLDGMGVGGTIMALSGTHISSAERWTTSAMQGQYKILIELQCAFPHVYNVYNVCDVYCVYLYIVWIV